MTQPATAPGPSASRPHRLRRIAAAPLRAIPWMAVFVLGAWAALAVCYADLSGRSPRTFSAAGLAAALIASIIFTRPRRYRFAGPAVLIGCVLWWYFSIQPRNDRQWRPDVAHTPVVEINGDRLTVHNVRHCEWRSDDDFTARWSDDNYRLSELQSVDVIFCHWGSKAIAHAMISFGFADGRYLCASIETRLEAAEQQVALQSFFRQYELIYIFSDERDLIRVRTNIRHEDVYLYRLNATGLEQRSLLLSYAERANRLAAKPEFYNGLTSNCVTNVVHMSRVVNPDASVNWEILLSGYAPRRAYRNGRLNTALPFADLEAQSLINEAAKAANDDPDFSKAIRVGRPFPTTLAGRG